jgi:hypothetical protein
MSLQSKLFKGDPNLEACAVVDSRHVLQGAAGPHVSKIQEALVRLDKAAIASAELGANKYGSSTAAAVLTYKQKRRIINSSYQAQPDNIVGKMTIASLDKEILALEKQTPLPPQSPTMSALAQKDKATSLQWAQAAIARLTDAREFLASPPPGPLPGFPPSTPPAIGLTWDALEVHFHISTSTIPRVDYIAKLIATYQQVVHVLNASTNFFVDDTTSAEAVKGTPAHVPFGSGKINFTPAFKVRDQAAGTGFGPKCRAAMVLHEPIHVVDHPDASFAANHISELSPSYETQPAANQLHNAHSYAAFAQQVFFGSDTRFGAGKPDQ